MRASIVSDPTRSAFITKAPSPLIEPPVTGAAASFVTGSGSPVSIDSSTADEPSVTMPSTGIASPGLTRK